MSTIMQIIFINLIVSFDNVGVIALSTRDLLPKDAALARRIGIGLSLILKLVFIGIIGIMISIPWLHIRIVGGVLLLYVTFIMLQQYEGEQQTFPTKKERNDSFFTSIIAIIAADVSMSIDNVIAIMGVVSSDIQGLNVQDYLLILSGLIVCVPILLIFSKSVTNLMERLPILTYLCAAYLTYTSVKMIFQDDVISYFCKQANFNFMTAAAVICGALVFVYGLLSRKNRLSMNKLKRGIIFLLYCAIVSYSIVLVGAISYFWTNHTVEPSISVLLELLNFQPLGANAVYLISISSRLFGICAITYAGTMYEKRKKMSFLRLFLINARAMLIFVLLEMLVCTAGLTNTFGFGTYNFVTIITLFVAQMLPLIVYSAVFSMLTVTAHNKVSLILFGLLYIFVEHFLATICAVNEKVYFLARYIPSNYLSTFLWNPMKPILFFRIFTVSVIYIVVVLWLGAVRHESSQNKIYNSLVE